MRKTKPKQIKPLKVKRLPITFAMRAKANLTANANVRQKLLEVIDRMKELDNESGMVSWTSPVALGESFYSKEEIDEVVMFFKKEGFPTNVTDGEFRVFR